MTDYDFEITEVSTLEDIFPQKRDCLKELKEYLFKKSSSRICILYGLRRTGKTVLLKQTLLSLNESEHKKAVFITCNANTDFYNVLSFIKESIDAKTFVQIKYLKINEFKHSKRGL